MKLIEKIKEIIEKNEDCEILLDDGLKVMFNEKPYAIEIDFEEDDDCMVIGWRSVKPTEKSYLHSYESQAYDIEDMSEINSLEIVHCEIID